MGAIDIGAGATDRAASTTIDKTQLDLNNPANDTGILDTVELYFATGSDGANIKIGTFYGSSTSWTSRDYETIGSVSSGSKQTFTGKSIDVQTGDIIGIYGTGGELELTATGGSGMLYKSGDQFGAGTQTYTSLSGRISSMFGSGDPVGHPARKRMAGNPFSPFRKGVW